MPDEVTGDLNTDDGSQGNNGGAPAGVVERPAWMAQLPDELKGHETLAGFKTLGELGSKYLETDGTVKQLNERLGKAIPMLGENATPEEVAEYRKALGVPEKPSDYVLTKPEKLPEGMLYNEALEAKFKETAHALGLTPKQVEGLQQMQIAEAVAMHTRITESIAAQRQKAVDVLKDMWKGDAYKENTEKAIRSFHKFVEAAVPPEALGGAKGIQEWVDKNGIGDDPVMVWFFSRAFDLIGDDRFIKGTPDGGDGKKSSWFPNSNMGTK